MKIKHSRNTKFFLTISLLMLLSSIIYGQKTVLGKISKVNSLFSNANKNISETGVDQSFNPPFSFNPEVYAADIQEDGKIIIAGNFSFTNEAKKYRYFRNDRVARLNVDGSVDETFDFQQPQNWQTSNPVGKIKVLPDGKILISKDWRIVRFNTDGSIDNSFISVSFIGGWSSFTKVLDIDLLPDGKLLVTGSFVPLNNQTNYNVARLNYDGSLDESFRCDYGNGVSANNAAIDGKGNIYLALYNPFMQSVGLLPKLKINGDFDNTFRWSLKSESYKFATGFGDVTDIISESDGSLIVSGRLSLYLPNNQTNLSGIYRMDENGNLIQQFEGEFSGIYTRLLKQSDGKIVAFNSGNLVRYFPDGQLDSTFQHTVANYFYPQFKGVLQQKDGKILIHGLIREVDGIPKYGIVRFNTEN